MTRLEQFLCMAMLALCLVLCWLMFFSPWNILTKHSYSTVEDPIVPVAVPVMESFDAAVNAICGDKTKQYFMIYFSHRMQDDPELAVLPMVAGSERGRDAKVIQVDLDALGEESRSIRSQIVVGGLNWNADKLTGIPTVSSTYLPMNADRHKWLFYGVSDVYTMKDDPQHQQSIDCSDAIRYAWAR